MYLSLQNNWGQVLLFSGSALRPLISHFVAYFAFPDAFALKIFPLMQYPGYSMGI